MTSAQTSNVSSLEESQENAAQRRAAGEFVRGISSAREWVEPSEAVPGRYHLIVAYNCPWCHRVALAREVLGLQEVISMDVLMPVRTEEDHPMGEGKWQFLPEGLVARNGELVRFPECTADRVTGKTTVQEIYQASGIEQTSVPILFDKRDNKVVNNESADIMRMLETVFNHLGTNELELYPPNLADEIEEWNRVIYSNINNGAYKAGFSKLQAVHQQAHDAYFDTLNQIEAALQTTKFLCGDQPTEADLRLFPTIFRHDPVYYLRMKLNKAYIAEYPCLWRWLSDLYHLPGVGSASPLAHMKQGYFGRTGNNIVPIGPADYLKRLQDRDFAARRAVAIQLADAAFQGRSADELVALAQDLANLGK